MGCLSNRTFFRGWIASSKQKGDPRIQDSCGVSGLHNFLGFFHLYCFIKYFSNKKRRAKLKCHNRVYILSSKHNYRPMRVHAVSQLFYKCLFKQVAIRGNDAGIKPNTKKICTGRDCQHWTVGNWSKVGFVACRKQIFNIFRWLTFEFDEWRGDSGVHTCLVDFSDILLVSPVC